MNKREGGNKVPESFAGIIRGLSGGAGAHFLFLTYHSIEPFLRSLITREALLVRSKSRGVIVAAPVNQPGRMLDVQHLVIDDVLHKPFRNFARIQNFAYGNCVVNGVVVTKDASSPALRPG